ncbi:cytochrome c biogenesis protein ResB [Tessaracoccus lubricantis]|uniref:Cytochrome c biogenesis protein ResB n=1 Tax=Tessaracoccus lubricantis TaxID=545543 RepID=A0ABP9F113_9ACTN
MSARRNPVAETLRWAWGQLTSMRTALLLLFLLAIASIPGSIIPQRNTEPIEVIDFKAANPGLDRILEPLGFYDIYTSAVFSAVYLLLFASLIGCIIPRVGKYWRAVRKPPPRLPARVERLPVALSGSLTDADGAMARAEAWLRAKRYRTRVGDDGVSAERGYLREFGNLTFHLSLVAVLAGLAWSNLWGFSGSAIVVEGRGFANVITRYDDFTAGGLLETDALERFSVTIDEFHAEFETGEVQRGAARVFDADVTLTDADGTRPVTMTVNQPLLTAGGTQVNLQAHGYAPVFTVTDGNGDVAFSGPVVFLPQDGNFSSMGVIKVPDARPQRLAFEAWFLPTAVLDERGPHSVFPDALNPEVFINAWSGEPAVETGVPENVYVLNTDGLAQVPGDDGQVLSARMLPGAHMSLPDGLGSISFDGYHRWVRLQVSQTPGNLMTLISISVGVIGLTLSLYVRPRRLFVRVADGGVTVGGLDRTDTATGLDEEVAALFGAVTGEPGHNGGAAPRPDTEEPAE